MPTSMHSSAAATSAPATTDMLEARIERLERELTAARRESSEFTQRSSRRARRFTVGTLLAGLAGVGALMAAGLPDSFSVVRTKRLEIVDDQNRVVGLFTVAADGGQFDLWSTTGTNVARIAATTRGGDLSLWNTEGKASMGAFVDEGGGRLEVYDDGGRPMGRLSASRTGGEMVLSTNLGKAGVIARTDDRGGGIAACDAIGRPLAELSAINGAGMALVADKNARPVASLKSTERGGAIELTDGRGAPAFSAGADVGGGSFSVVAADGKPILTGGAAPLGGGTFEVRNAAGEAVVAASVGEAGCGRFSVSTPDGQRGMVVQGNSTSYGLAILEASRRVAILEANAGGGRMELTDTAARAAAVLGIDPEWKTGAIGLRDANGKELVRISADEKGNGRMAVYNRSGEDRKIYGVK